MKPYQQIGILFVAFFILSFIAIFTLNVISNIFLESLVISITLILFILAYIYIKKEEPLSLEDKNSTRYTMHCRSCGWEWMSNISDKTPSTCPNCKSHEKLEIIGWRKIKLSENKQKEKDLRNFFKI